MAQVILVVGMIAAGTLALLADVDRLETVLLPGIVMGLILLGVALHRRVRIRQQWFAAWDAYAEREVEAYWPDLGSEQEIISLANTN